MDKKIRGMIREIERRGGVIAMNESLRDDVAEEFLQEILRCPHCRAGAAASSAGPAFADGLTIDQVLAGSRVPDRLKGH